MTGGGAAVGDNGAVVSGTLTKEQWFALSTSNIKNHMRTRGISTARCEGKADLVDRLVDHQAASSSSKPPQLPPLKQKHPLTFEDLYTMSRHKVQKRNAGVRQGGLGQALATSGQLPRLPGRKAGFLPSSLSMSGSPLSMSQSCGALPWGPGEASWASKCLDDMPKITVTAMEEDSMPKISVTAAERRNSKEQNTPIVPKMGELSDLRRASVRQKSPRPGLLAVDGGVASERPASRGAGPDQSDWRRRVPSKEKQTAQAEALEDDHTDLGTILRGPSMKDIEERTPDDGFSDYEMDKMKQAFKRWKLPSTEEIHKDDISSFLATLGFLKCGEDQVQILLAEVTNYATLTFIELCTFIEKYSAFEREEFQKVFEENLEPGASELSTTGLESLLRHLGITPFRETIAEVLEIVDVDHSGSINFYEFIFLFATYRLSEGFTRVEVKDLHRVFLRFAVERKLSKEEKGYPGMIAEIEVSELRNALLHMFGPQAFDLATMLAGKVGCKTQSFATEQDLVKEEGQRADVKAPPPKEQALDHPLSFHEFLGWARALREAEVEEYRKQFLSFDSSGDGRLMTTELPPLFQRLGYTPLEKTMDELLDEVDVNADGSIDFDEFVHLMATFRSTDGFTQAEGEELREAFDAFDKEENGEIESLQLLDLLRFLGYLTNLDDARRFLKQVDFNDSHSLDFREFLHLMRLHREEELMYARKAFDAESEARRDNYVMPAGVLRDTLVKLAYSEKDLERFPEMLQELEVREDEMLTFDRFVDVVDLGRRIRMMRLRRQGGFTDAEIDQHREKYNGYDLDGNGTIEKKELMGLISDLGIPLRDIADQQKFLERIQAARDRALDNGVPFEDVGQKGDPAVLFWVFVHLARILLDQSDRKEVDREEKAVKATKFNPDEVNEFREVFEYWALKVALLELETNREGGVGATMKAAPSPDDESMVDSKLMSIDGLKRVLRSFGCSVGPAERRQLDEQVFSLTGVTNGKVDFPDFLRMMRWMLDRNFASINEMAEKAVSTPKASEK